MRRRKRAHSIRFEIKDHQSARTEAIRLATTRAKASAQAIANALGVRVLGVVSAVVNGPADEPLPVPELGFVREKRVVTPTPVQEGTVSFQASVTVTLEVGP
jgi:uncharacterized protein YggE